jgi:hypothetical protein
MASIAMSHCQWDICHEIFHGLCQYVMGHWDSATNQLFMFEIFHGIYSHQ